MGINKFSLGPTIAQRAALDNSRITFHTFFLDQLERMDADPMEQLANEVPSDSAIEQYDWIGDIPELEEWVGDRVEANTMVGAFQIKNKDFSSGIRIHKNEILDDKLNLIKPRVEGLAKASRYHYADLLAKFLVNGFDGTTYPTVSTGICYDGQLFFSTTHSAEGGPAQSNKLTIALDADGVALDTAVSMLGDLRTHTGSRPLRVRPTHLIVGPDLEPMADRLLSDKIIVNSSGNAAGQSRYAGRFQKLVSPELSGAFHNYWFLADLSAPLRPLILQKREGITSTALTDWSSEEMYRRGVQRFGAQSRDNAGYGAWQTIIGSKVAQ